MKPKLVNRLFTRTLIAFLLILSTGTAVAATKNEVKGSITYSHKMVTGSPIDVGLEVRGVKLESLYFSENMEALVILWNKTPVSVHPEVGIALFDKSGKLLGTGTKSSKLGSSNVRAGKQKNYTLQFDRFMNDYSKVAKFQLIFSIIEKKTGSSSKGSREEYDEF